MILGVPIFKHNRVFSYSDDELQYTFYKGNTENYS